MKQATPEQEIETCLRFLDDILADIEDWKMMLRHRPEALKLKLAELDIRFVEWSDRLARLEKRTYP